MNISLPDDMRVQVEKRVKDGLYANVSDYIRALIRDDLSGEGDWPLDATTVAAIEEGEASGYSDRSIEEIFAEARARYVSR